MKNANLLIKQCPEHWQWKKHEQHSQQRLDIFNHTFLEIGNIALIKTFEF